MSSPAMSRISHALGVAAVVLALSACERSALPAAPAEPQVETPAPAPAPISTATELRPLADFAGMGNAQERSLALYGEVAKVLTHPRCLNCHPKGDIPTQGMDLHSHQPPVTRGAGGMGDVGMYCFTCHQMANFEPSGVPGNPKWHLAPPEMAWQAQSLGQICAQLKDPQRNGGRDLAQLHEHMAHDILVGWGWNPGSTRAPAPGTQRQFGELFAAWIDSGAVCPDA